MITVKTKQVPTFLQSSAFYAALDKNGGSFQIPKSCYGTDTKVDSAEALVLFLSTARFWGSQHIPTRVVQFCAKSRVSDLAHHIAEFERDLPFARFLSAVAVGTKTAAPHDQEECKRVFYGFSDDVKWDASPEICVTQLCKVQNRFGRGVWTTDTTALAALYGLLHALRFLHEHGCPWNTRTCENAARANSLACLQYAHENGCPWDSRTCSEAASQKTLHCLQYAHEHGCPWNQCALSAAICGMGTTSTLCFEYLRLHGCPVGEEVIAGAAATGNLPLVRKLRAEGCAWSAYACRRAAIRGQLEVLRYLHEQGCPWGPETCAAAASGHSVECLKYAHENGCPLTAEALQNAINHLPCLDYLLALQNCPGRDSLCELLVAKSDLGTLQFAVERGCPLTAAACAAAAGAGALDTLVFLHERGCPWDAETCSSAARKGNLPCLQYAHEHGCAWEVSASWLAATHSDVSCLQYVHEHGGSWNARTCSTAAAAGSLVCLQYARERGCAWNAGTPACAILSGHLDCLRYAHEQGCPWQYTMVKRRLQEPVTAAQQECMEYALANGIYERPLVRLERVLHGAVRQASALFTTALRWNRQHKVGVEPPV